jgi:hypothetical protein
MSNQILDITKALGEYDDLFDADLMNDDAVVYLNRRNINVEDLI